MKRIMLLGLLSIMLLVVGCSSDEAVYITTDGMDKTSQALTTISLAEHEIHDGDAYGVKSVVDLGNGAVRDIQITTPNTTVWAHMIISFETESETEWYLYEDVNIIAPGTDESPYNANRNSTNTTTLAANYIDNANIGAANADTAVAAATALFSGISGAGKDSGDFDHQHELVLKQNEDYSLRFVATTAGYVNYHLDWYEYTNLE